MSSLAGSQAFLWEGVGNDIVAYVSRVAHTAYRDHDILTSGTRRRGLALRYTGDDVRYDPRPGTFQFPHRPDLAAGAPMECELFPKAFP